MVTYHKVNCKKKKLLKKPKGLLKMLVTVFDQQFKHILMKVEQCKET